MATLLKPIIIIGIKWKERQERRLKLEAPKIESVHSPLHAQTGSDVIRDNLVLPC